MAKMMSIWLSPSPSLGLIFLVGVASSLDCYECDESEPPHCNPPVEVKTVNNANWACFSVFDESIVMKAASVGHRFFIGKMGGAEGECVWSTGVKILEGIVWARKEGLIQGRSADDEETAKVQQEMRDWIHQTNSKFYSNFGSKEQSGLQGRANWQGSNKYLVCACSKQNGCNAEKGIANAPYGLKPVGPMTTPPNEDSMYPYKRNNKHIPDREKGNGGAMHLISKPLVAVFLMATVMAHSR